MEKWSEPMPRIGENFFSKSLCCDIINQRNSEKPMFWHENLSKIPLPILIYEFAGFLNNWEEYALKLHY